MTTIIYPVSSSPDVGPSAVYNGDGTSVITIIASGTSIGTAQSLTGQENLSRCKIYLVHSSVGQESVILPDDAAGLVGNTVEIYAYDYPVKVFPNGYIGSGSVDEPVSVYPGHGKIFRKVDDNLWQVVGDEPFPEPAPVVFGNLTSVTASGTTQGAGTGITATTPWTVASITVVPSPLSNAVVLPTSPTVGDIVEVYSSFGTAKVFPASGHAISPAATNASVDVVPGQGRFFRYISSNTWQVSGVGSVLLTPTIVTLTASGTTQGAGTSITASTPWTIAIVASNTSTSNYAVKLPASPSIGDLVEVYSNPASSPDLNGLFVFPASGMKIGNFATNANEIVKENQGRFFRYVSANTWQVSGAKSF